MAFLAFFGRFFKNLFGKDGYLKRKVIPEVIKAINNIKEFDDLHPEFADLLTQLTSTTKDDEIKEKLRAGLKVALEKMTEFNACLAIVDEEERFKCIVAQLQAITDGDKRAMKWTELAAYTTKFIANDARLDIAEIAVLIKLVYNKTDDEDDDTDD